MPDRLAKGSQVSRSEYGLSRAVGFVRRGSVEVCLVSFKLFFFSGGYKVREKSSDLKLTLLLVSMCVYSMIDSVRIYDIT